MKQAIYSAVSNAVIEAIINYYTPYGLVFAAESLADFAGSLKLQPIIFASGSIELTDNQMEKLIVTGGLGFIGSNLIEYLLKKGHFVINIDKLTEEYNNSNY